MPELATHCTAAPAIASWPLSAKQDPTIDDGQEWRAFFFGKVYALPLGMATRHLVMDFWRVDHRHCLLAFESGQLEVRLFDREQLVAMRPCETASEAMSVAREWRERPPAWPPF